MGDFVVCKIITIDEIGAYAELLEYDNVSGMIQFSELSRRRIKSVKQVIRLGTIEVLYVIRVDDKYIDLSKKKVTVDEAEETMEYYHKSKKVFSIASALARTRGVDVEKINEKYVWPLYEKYEHAYDGFEEMMIKGVEVYEMEEIVDEDDLMEIVREKCKKPVVKIFSHLQITNFTESGVNGIKRALKEASDEPSKDVVAVTLIASPNYMISGVTSDVIDAKTLIRKINDHVTRIQKTIKEQGGEVIVKEFATVMGDKNKSVIDDLIQDRSDEER